jgi:predicted transcriptional regulator
MTTRIPDKPVAGQLIEAEVPPTAEMHDLPPDIELRRKEVVRLRLRRMSQSAIAALLGVDQATISRDLQWIREHWEDKYGSPASVSPAHELGEAVSMYEDAEQSALMEFHLIQQSASKRGLSPMFISRQRMACLRTAMVARKMRVDLLHDFGLIERNLGSVSVQSSGLKADELRQYLRDEGLLDENPKKQLSEINTSDMAERDPVAEWIIGEDNS